MIVRHIASPHHERQRAGRVCRHTFGHSAFGWSKSYPIPPPCCVSAASRRRQNAAARVWDRAMTKRLNNAGNAPAVCGQPEDSGNRSVSYRTPAPTPLGLQADITIWRCVPKVSSIEISIGVPSPSLKAIFHVTDLFGNWGYKAGHQSDPLGWSVESLKNFSAM
jgi:hypothetical protein